MLRDKLNLALIAGIVIAVCGILIYSPAPAVKAADPPEAINIVDKVGTVAVATITFPVGAPGETVSAPYNSVNGDTDPQVLGALSEPVVRLHNTHTAALTVTLQISGWTGGVVTAEYYELVDPGIITNVTEVTTVLSAGGGAASVATGISIPTGAKWALYLEVDLSAGYRKSGDSVLTILGQE